MAKLGGSTGLSVPDGNYLFTVTSIGVATPREDRMTGEFGNYALLELTLEGSDERTSYYVDTMEFNDINLDSPGVTVGQGRTGRLIAAINPAIPYGTLIKTFNRDFEAAVMGQTVLGVVAKDREGKYTNVRQVLKADWQMPVSDTYLLRVLEFSKPQQSTFVNDYGKTPWQTRMTAEIVDLDPVEGIHSYNGQEIEKYLTVDNFQEFGGRGNFTEKSGVYKLMEACLDTLPEEDFDYHGMTVMLTGKYFSGTVKTGPNKNGVVKANLTEINPVSSKDRRKLGLPQKPGTTVTAPAAAYKPTPWSKPLASSQTIAVQHTRPAPIPQKAVTPPPARQTVGVGATTKAPWDAETEPPF